MPNIWLRDKLVQDVALEEVILVSKNQKLAEVIHTLQKKRADRVIVTNDNIPTGVVTVKDIFLKLDSSRLRKVSPRSMAVSGLSSGKLITARPDENLLETAQRLESGGVSALPVLDDDGRAIGLLKKMHIILLLKNKYHAPLNEVIISYVGTIGLSAKLNQALDSIRRSPIRELVVVEDQRPVGILGEREVAVALFNLLSTDSIHHAGSILDRLLVTDVMRRIRSAMPLESDLVAATNMFQSEMTNTLPVMQDEKIVGLVTRDGVFRYILHEEEIHR